MTRAAALLVMGGLMLHPGRSQPQPNAYVDAAQCARCHAQIAATYSRTGMGRSFAAVAPGSIAHAQPFYHAASGSYFSMVERGGKYYQRRWQIGFDGKQTNVDEKQVDFVLGSGNHSRTYLHLTAQHTLQQLPLGWYAEKGGYWAMNPGYDRPDYPGSTRPITYECMFCHNAYPAIPTGHDEPGAQPEFLTPLPQGIDCQRCHGPGQRHVEAASRGAGAEIVRAAIVNPRRLSADREMEVCMQCHLETSTEALPHAIRRLDRGPFSYVPGQPLGDFHLTFDRAGGMGERFEVAHAAYRLRESPCFLKSAGKLRCTTCHDPHNIPRGAEAVRHYNAICQGCHAAKLQVSAASAIHRSGADCITCHMPKRRTDDAVHIVMTDHFIRARQPAGDLLAGKSEVRESAATAYRGEVVPYYPNEVPALYGALAQVREWSNLKEGVPRLRSLVDQQRPRDADYYVELSQALAAGGHPMQAVPYAEEAVRLAPSSAILRRRLGGAELDAGKPAAAEVTLRESTKLSPGDAVGWGMLGQALAQQHKDRDAAEAYRQGIVADPELAALHNSLGTLLEAAGNHASAGREFREAIRIQPGDAGARANLASLLALQNQIPEARFQFAESIRLDPGSAPARLNYARLLASTGETSAAEEQVRASLQADPNLAGAHQLLGSLLATRGDNDGAARELATAVQLQPDYGRAQFELGVVLGRMGNSAGALEHLRIAAASNDPDASASARQLLQKLGR